MVATFLDHNKTELKQRRRRGQRKQQKARDLISKTLLSRHCTTATWNFPNFMCPLYGISEHNTQIFFFFFYTFAFKPRKFRQRLTNKMHEVWNGEFPFFLLFKWRLRFVVIQKICYGIATWRKFSSLLAILSSHAYRTVALFPNLNVICALYLYHLRRNAPKKYASGSLYGWCLE